ncbi:hypothetical protein C2G38_2220559 [Gigaspora rosea]|uniref:FAR1 domain-containing protein n=1 Tax=Gigaspora rosea TaxID=44941 RepID=A0A397U7S5_9GLOM|nr:hypothetical protein C2G38_2220559 [Gigaspora rosea]
MTKIIWIISLKIEDTRNLEFHTEFQEDDNRNLEYPITLEKVFTNWAEVDLCMRGRPYDSRKEAHIVKECNRGHHTGKCGYQVNTYRRKSDNMIHISKISGQHDHVLVKNIEIVATYYRKLTPEMYNEIRLLAASGVHSGAIIEVLQKKNPEKYIHARNVYNIIQTSCAQEKKVSDARAMFLELLKYQQKDPTFYIDAQFERDNNYLTRLFWMSPNQQQLWARFHDVILLDSTAKTN